METTLKQIEAILDEKVRPILKEHGGDVIIQSLEDQILKVRLTGKCSRCPAAHSTNEELITYEIQTAFPNIKDVVLVEEINPELIDMAHKILNHPL
ncbi:NifU family protein [Clostridium sp. E02]|uniref:NifU family protein n=1 Tax=Clostridium sp. E02 TaxID=2487134 RepID=UPI000F54571C|nr:NifU family protein [Clostridium sp. E02]